MVRGPKQPGEGGADEAGSTEDRGELTEISPSPFDESNEAVVGDTGEFELDENDTIYSLGGDGTLAMVSGGDPKAADLAEGGSRDAQVSGYAPTITPDELTLGTPDQSADAPSSTSDVAVIQHEQGDLKKGDMIGNKYRVVSRIGAGGMGTVYKVVDQDIERQLGVEVSYKAAKILHATLTNKAEAVARFRGEARALLELEHSNIVSASDIGKTEDGSIFFVMPYMKGEDLADLLSETGAIPWPDTYEIILQVFAALIAAHEKRIIHRDLKPENLFITRPTGGRCVVKLLDFGVAKIIDSNEMQTREGLLFGTPTHMSPEQFEGKPDAIDGRSDIYCGGIILYEMLTGKLPFRAPAKDGRGRWLSAKDSVKNWALAHTTLDPVPPSEANPDVYIPERIEELVLQMLKKDKNDRPSSAYEVYRAIQEVGPKIDLGTSATVMAAQPAPGRLTMRDIRRSQTFPSIRAWTLAAVLLALGVGGGVAYNSYVGKKDKSGKPTVTSPDSGAYPDSQPTESPDAGMPDSGSPDTVALPDLAAKPDKRRTTKIVRQKPRPVRPRPVRPRPKKQEPQPVISPELEEL